jgi:hypothetical protein
MLAMLPRTSHNVTCSEDLFDNTLFLACPHNTTHELYCDQDTVGVWEVTCPSVTTNMTCRSLQPEESGLSLGEACEVVSMLNSTIMCECPTSMLYTRSAASGNSSLDSTGLVDVEFTAMLEFVVEDFVSTWRSVDNLSGRKLAESKQVLVTLGILMLFMVAGMHYSECADTNDELQQSKVDKRINERKLKESGDKSIEVESKENIVECGVVDLDAIFPKMLTEEHFIFLFIDELKKSHRWASIYFNYDKKFPRALRFLSLSSVVICTLFFNSLLYNLTNPDDGSCKGYMSETNCLSEASQYSSQDTKCHWQENNDGREGGRCQFREPSSSAIAMIFVAVVSAVLSIPFVVIFEFIIMEVLSRPTTHPNSSTHPTSTSDNPDSTAVIDADIMKNREALEANIMLKELVDSLYIHMQKLSVKSRSELECLWGISLFQLKKYMESMEGGGLNADVVTATQRARKHAIQPSALMEYNIHADEVIINRKRSPGIVRRTMDFVLGISDETKVFHNILRDIIATRTTIREETVKLESMSPKEQGIRLLVLFQKDLLVGLSGEIVEKKSIQGKRIEIHPVSKWTKVGGFVFIFLLNMSLLFYIFLFAINQTQARQSAWVKSFLIWLALEIFLVSSLVMVVSEFIVPSLVFSEVKKIKTKMIDMVYLYQSKLVDARSSLLEESNSTFDAAPYLFTSTQLARKFPDSLESKIIREFKTEVPKRSYQYNKKSTMKAYRSRLRLTALMNSINLVFLFIIGHLLSLSISSLERCLYDLLGWAIFGYFVFFQVVLFQDNALVAFFVYLSLIMALGTFIYFYYKSATRLRNRNRSGVISLKTIVQERELKEQDYVGENSTFVSPAHLLMLNIVQKMAKHQPSKYNPRYAKIMESLKNTDDYTRGILRDDTWEEDEEKCRFSHRKLPDDYSDDIVVRPGITSKYVGMMQSKTPAIVKRISSRKADLHRMFLKRSQAPTRKNKLKLDLGLDIDLSDCSDDSYPGDECNIFSISSDSESSDEYSSSSSSSNEENSESDVTKKINVNCRSICPKLVRIIHSNKSKILHLSKLNKEHMFKSRSCGVGNSIQVENIEGLRPGETTLPGIGITNNVVATTAAERLATTERTATTLFSKPKYLSNLAVTVHKHSEEIKKISMKRRAQGIADSFVLSSEARRASIIASQTRAHTKLQKRIELKKSAICDEAADSDNTADQAIVVHPRPGFSHTPSFRIFSQKKEIVKTYTAHQSLRRRTLEIKRQEAKASLQARKSKPKVRQHFDAVPDSAEFT